MKMLKAKLMRRYLETVTRDRVVVHLKSGPSIQGVLTGVHNDVIVLQSAVALSPSQGQMVIDGEPLIERVNVAWIQHLPSGEA